MGVSSGKPHLSPVFGVTQREAVMECARECVRGEGRERKRRENRAELIRQLEEVELSERKERSKVNDTNPHFTDLHPSTALLCDPISSWRETLPVWGCTGRMPSAGGHLLPQMTCFNP